MRFDFSGPRLHRSGPVGHTKSSPHRGSYPSKNSPRSQPYRITAALAFLALPRVLHQMLPKQHSVPTAPPLPKERCQGGGGACHHRSEIRFLNRCSEDHRRSPPYIRRRTKNAVRPLFRRQVMLRSDTSAGPPRHQAIRPKPYRPTAEAACHDPEISRNLFLRSENHFLPKQQVASEKLTEVNRTRRNMPTNAKLSEESRLRRTGEEQVPESPCSTTKLTFKALLRKRVRNVTTPLPAL
jgi:hypothetical protein